MTAVDIRTNDSDNHSKSYFLYMKLACVVSTQVCGNKGKTLTGKMGRKIFPTKLKAPQGAIMKSQTAKSTSSTSDSKMIRKSYTWSCTSY